MCRLAANKSDLAESREVTEEEGREAAEQHKCARYAETSAKTSDGIQGAETIATMTAFAASATWK